MLAKTLLDGLARKAAHYVARMPSPAAVRELGDITIINSGIPSDTFNCVISRGRQQTEPELVADICADFNLAGLPAAWWTVDGVRPDFLAGELARHGFVEDETNVGMLAEIDAIPRPATPAGFEVRILDSAAEILEHGRLLAALADPPDPATLAYYAAVSELDELGGAMRLFTGDLDGEPVSTASLLLDGELGHVYDLSTTPAVRGRGLGTTMMRVVLDHARALGARRAGLQASQAGIGVYRKLGFVEVCVFRVYSNRANL